MYDLKQKCCQTTCCCLLLECFFLSLTTLWKHSTWRRLEAGSRVSWTWTMKILGNKGKTCGGSNKLCNQTLWQWQIALTEIVWHVLTYLEFEHYSSWCSRRKISHNMCFLLMCACMCYRCDGSTSQTRSTHKHQTVQTAMQPVQPVGLESQQGGKTCRKTQKDLTQTTYARYNC